MELRLKLELESIRYFIKVIEQKSFNKAAQILNVPKSNISKSISRLENQLSTKLIQRTTRNLTLTPAGQHLFAQCQSAIYQLESANQTLLGSDKVLAGPVRLTAPEDLGAFVIAPAIADLTKAHSKITFELNYTDQVIDLVKDGYDLAVRIGQLNQSRFKAKKVGEINLIMVASPTYLRKTKRIHHPKELVDHECISFRARSLSQQWTLRSQNSKLNIAVKSRVTSNQMTSLLQIVQNDVGVALIPAYLCQNRIKEGSLIQVLPNWTSHGMPVYLISPNPTALSARIKLTSDHLAERLKDALAFT